MRTSALLLLALNACVTDVYAPPDPPVGHPTEDAAPAAIDAGSSADSAPDAAAVPDASPDSAPVYTCNILYNGNPQRIACSGSNPFTWLTTLDGGQQTQVSCADKPCPWAAKCFVQGISGSGVCAQ